jgi:hypothetical protein
LDMAGRVEEYGARRVARLRRGAVAAQSRLIVVRRWRCIGIRGTFRLMTCIAAGSALE